MKENKSAPMNIIDSRAVARVAPGAKREEAPVTGKWTYWGYRKPPRNVQKLYPQNVFYIMLQKFDRIFF